MEQRQKFNTSKDLIHFIPTWIPVLLLVGMKIFGIQFWYSYLDYFMIGFLLLLASASWFRTYYIIEGSTLILKSKWKDVRINISDIIRIESDTEILGDLGSGISLGTKGLRLFINKSVKFGLTSRRDIKISPENTEDFMAEIISRNSNIRTKLLAGQC